MFLRNFEWPVLHVANNILIVHLATDEALGVEYRVLGIRVESVLRAVSNPELLKLARAYVQGISCIPTVVPHP